jgi:hypothetical protein
LAFSKGMPENLGNICLNLSSINNLATNICLGAVHAWQRVGNRMLSLYSKLRFLVPLVQQAIFPTIVMVLSFLRVMVD